MAQYKLSAEVPITPFYNYDLDLLDRTIGECKAAAGAHGYHVHYAIKANVEPQLLERIACAGLGADCVSGWEVEAALEAGFAASRVVFAGVGKSDQEMMDALERDIFCFNCESLEEIEVLNQLARHKGRVARIALRLNPDIEPDTHEYIATGQSASKFGISPAELSVAMERIYRYDSISLVGVHFHIGSGILNMDNFRDLALKANQINDWFADRGIELKHLNMGGGLGISYANPDGALIPDFKAYFDVFAGNLRPHVGQEVHFELGRSIVAQCGELITRVLFTKTTASGEKFVITDAGMTELIRPALYSAVHRIENITAQKEGRDQMERCYVAGPICESSDVFARDIQMPVAHRGDLLAIRSCGAYGAVMSSRYNLRPLAKSYFSSTQK